MVGQLLHVSPEKRVTGSVACAVIAAMQGARIVRVHDVAATVDALKVWQALAEVAPSRKDKTPPQPEWPDGF